MYDIGQALLLLVATRPLLVVHGWRWRSLSGHFRWLAEAKWVAAGRVRQVVFVYRFLTTCTWNLTGDFKWSLRQVWLYLRSGYCLQLYILYKKSCNPLYKWDILPASALYISSWLYNYSNLAAYPTDLLEINDLTRRARPLYDLLFLHEHSFSKWRQSFPSPTCYWVQPRSMSGFTAPKCDSLSRPCRPTVYIITTKSIMML